MLNPPQPNPSAPDCSPRFTVLQEPQRTVIQLKSVKLPFGQRLAAIFIATAWFLFTALFTALTLFSDAPHGPPGPLPFLDTKPGGLLFLLPFWLIGLAGLHYYVCTTKRIAIFIITPDDLTVIESRFLGHRAHYWPRSDLLDVGFDGHKIRIQILARAQPPVNVAQDIYEWDLRWLTTTLQNLLDLAPKTPHPSTRLK